MKQEGHPLKGESLQKDGGQAREKTPLHDKKVALFCLALSPAPAQKIGVASSFLTNL